MKFSLINACSDLGVHINGAKEGPIEISKKLKDNKNINNIYNVTKNSEIIKSTDSNDKAKNLSVVNEFNEKLYECVQSIIKSNDLPITLGGDHSIVIASALASIKEHKNLGIIWIDSHGDYNNFNTTISGNLHGLPFAAITNYKDTDKLTKFHNGNYFNCQNAVLVGARDLDLKEKENLEAAGIKIFTTADIKNFGVDYVMNKAFEIASNNTNGVHISYDIDVIDPTIAPGVSIPAINGINLEEAYDIMDNIIQHKNDIRSIDLVELNPRLDKDDITLNIALNLLKKFIL